MAHNIFYRAYTLVEAAVDHDSAVDDLLSLARGDRLSLKQARDLVDELQVSTDPFERLEVVDVIGFDDSVADTEAYQRNAVEKLLDRAVAAA